MVSVIIPAYKATKYIDECLDSIHGAEILVGVDGCQETFNHLKHRSDIRLFFFPENIGPYIVKNTLMDLVSNECVLFFDSDDILAKGSLEKIEKNLQHVDFLKLTYINFRTKINFTGQKISDGIIAIKKSVFNQVNGFQPWRCAADTELSYRLLNKSFKHNLLSDVVCYRRIHGENLTVRQETGHGSPIRKKYVEYINQQLQSKVWPNPETKIKKEYVTHRNA